MKQRNAQSKGILLLNIRDESALHAAYMPWLARGGLFAATAKPHRLGDEVHLMLQLPDEAEKIPIAGKVAWVTPAGAEGNRRAGIGVQFSAADAAVAAKLEARLQAAGIPADRPTHTL